MSARRRYSREHHWAQADDRVPGRTRWGLSEHAQHLLGEIVSTTLPPVGTVLDAGQVYGKIESATALADLHAPHDATVAVTNAALATSPELVNVDPLGQGWLLVVEPPPPAGRAAHHRPAPAGAQRARQAPGDLMDAGAYAALVAAPAPRGGDHGRAAATTVAPHDPAHPGGTAPGGGDGA